MSDELLDHYREYGVPQTHHVYSRSEDGAIHDETFSQMESLSDFEAGSFYIQPKEKPKLKTVWRTRDIFADRPPPKESKPKPWRK